MGFFSDFFGGGGGDIQKSSEQAMAQLSGAKKKARSEISGGYNQALGYVQPYMDNGAGYNLYKDSIGANGTEGYGRAMANFSADPFLQGQEDASNNALTRMFRQYNSSGMGNSGVNRLAISRAAGERYQGNVADYRNRLMGLGQQGLGVAQYAGGLTTDRGNTLGNLEYGFGQQQASNTINTANALAASKAQGANNLLGLLGTVGGVASAALGSPWAGAALGFGSKA